MEIQTSPTSIDKWLDRLSWLALAFAWIYSIFYYTNLPETIPVHFNLQGEVDRYGNKIVLFLLPAIITVVVTGLHLLNRFPHKFNYPVTITPENKIAEYARATRLLRIIKLVIAVFSSIITVMIVSAAQNKFAKLPGWLLPSFIAALMLPVFYTLYRSFKKEKYK